MKTRCERILGENAEPAALVEYAVPETEPVASMELLAVNQLQAARLLGCSVQTIWRRQNLPARDPRRIRRTSYGTYPVEELKRHLRAETL